MTFEQIVDLNVHRVSADGAESGHESTDAVPERTIAVAGAADEAVLGAVEVALAAGVEFILFGDEEAIKALAKQAGRNIEGAVIRGTAAPGSPAGRAEIESVMCRNAVRACANGEAAVLMKGLVSTAAFTRAILDRDAAVMAAGTVLSHVGLFSDPRPGFSRYFLVTDAAININPDLERKKDILKNACCVTRALGNEEPRIALLAPVEKASEKIPSTMDAAALKEWVSAGFLGGASADGPLALDVAVSEESARIKGIQSRVPGRVDIFLVPNLDAGNLFYKSLTVFAGARSAGILAGATVPVVLTSRSDTEETKLASLAFALTIARRMANSSVRF